jgi:tRNA 2-thiouridine synthesizing protein A
MNSTVTQSLDLRGLSCPLPIIRTAKAMKQVAPGQLVEVLATDPGSVPDFTAWAKSTGNQLVDIRQADGVFHFVLKKKEV